VPISNGRVTDKLNIYLANNYTIASENLPSHIKQIGQILIKCLNLDEFDKSLYEKKIYDEFKITKKKKKTNIEPQPNLALEKQTSAEIKENIKIVPEPPLIVQQVSTSSMDEEVSVVSVSKKSSLQKKFFENDQSESNKNDPFKGLKPSSSLESGGKTPVQKSEPASSIFSDNYGNIFKAPW